MKFKFENLGAIDNAEIDLASLTVICGRNNTGKTYVTYAIYGLLTMWRQFIPWPVKQEILQTLEQQGAVSMDIESQLALRWQDMLIHIQNNWQSNLSVILGAPPTRFEKSRLSIELDLDNRWKERSFKRELRSEKDVLLFSAEKPARSSIITFASFKEAKEVFPDLALEDFIQQAVFDALLSPYIPTVFMVSTERTGAVEFKDELNLTKNKIVNLLAKADAKKSSHPGLLFQELFTEVFRQGYPLPVEHNVQFVNRFVNLENRTGVLLKQYPELKNSFERICGGHYETSKDGLMQFIPAGSKTRLQLSEASSAVRSLVVFWYWLKAEAAPGQMVMIDEPELNLHPENQRALARFLARLINCGIKVLMTTHSDTMIREFNSLLMLAGEAEYLAKVADRFGYSPDEKLDAKDVILYMAEGKPKNAQGEKRRGGISTLERVTPNSEWGLDAKLFDKTILDMNAMQNALRFGIVS